MNTTSGSGMASQSTGQQKADQGPCTIEELENIITAPAGGLMMEPSTAYDEILPGLYLGDGYDDCSLRKLFLFVLFAAL